MIELETSGSPAIEILECGCRREVTNDEDVLTDLCAGHLAIEDEATRKIRQILDYEMDCCVQEHAGGRRVERIWPSERPAAEQPRPRHHVSR